MNWGMKWQQAPVLLKILGATSLPFYPTLVLNKSHLSAVLLYCFLQVSAVGHNAKLKKMKFAIEQTHHRALHSRSIWKHSPETIKSDSALRVPNKSACPLLLGGCNPSPHIRSCSLTSGFSDARGPRTAPFAAICLA